MRPPPQPGEKHLAATVYILTQEEPRRVLFVHHKRFNKWLPPGGHVEWNENPYEAAIRETKEESGFDVASYLQAPRDMHDHSSFLPLPTFMLEERIDAHGDQPAHFHIDCVYVAHAPFAEVAHDPNESHGIGWFTYEEAIALETFADVRTSLKELFEK